MKNLLKIIYVCLLINLAIISTLNIRANEINNIDVKEYCTATINDSFSENEVCIILSNNESKKLKSYTTDDFLTNEISDIGISEIKELTECSTQTLIKQLEELNETTDINIDVESYRRIFSLTLSNKGKENVLEVIEKLKDNENYMYVGVNYINEYELTSINSDLTIDNNQYNNYNLANLSNTWNITTGSNEVLVGILDTGICNTHPDLIDNINVELSKDFTGDDNPFSYTNPHGTQVAGIIGANGSITGISPNVSLVSLKIMGGSNSINDTTVEVMSSRLIEAISYATEKGIKILNLSAGRYDNSYNALEKQAIENFNGIFVQAAGNYYNDIDETLSNYPVCYDCDNMIVVGGLDYNGLCAQDPSNTTWENGGSAYGQVSVDLFAPGTSVYTTTVINNVSTYACGTGTSMSAPFVTGTCALLLSIYPNLDAYDMKCIIMSTSKYNSAFENLCVSSGKLNIYNAITLNMRDGSGTALDPYIIDSVEKFNLIRYLDNTSIYFKQTTNLDFQNGKHKLHNYTFKGIYDGNNCYINNIFYSTNMILENQYIGGFVGFNQGTIKNVKFNNLNIEVFNNGNVVASVGGVVGFNASFIQNIDIYYSIISTDNYTVNTGGICGDSNYTGIENNIMDCYIQNSYILGSGNTGGIVGQQEDGIVYLCYLSNTTVSYSQEGINNRGCGGIIGFNKDKVISCSIDNNSIVEYCGVSTTLLIKPRLGKIVGLNWSGENNILNCSTTGIIDSGTLNSTYEQLDYIGAFYNGKVGLEQG